MDAWVGVVTIAVGASTLLVAFGRYVVRPLTELVRRIADFDNKLDDHMAVEEQDRAKEREAVDRIETMLDETRRLAMQTRDEGRVAALANVQAHIAIIKTVNRDNPIPTTVFAFEDGNYRYVWGSDSYHEMIEMGPDEARADLVWQTVHPDDRELLRDFAEHVASQRELLTAEYRLIDAHTQTTKGTVKVVAEYVPGNDRCWYYVTQYYLTESSNYG